MTKFSMGALREIKWDTVLDEAQAEQSDNARLEIAGAIGNLSDYDVIYLGFSNCWAICR